MPDVRTVELRAKIGKAASALGEYTRGLGTMFKSNLLGATALQTGALILFAASPAYAAQPTTNSVPPTTVVNPPAAPIQTNQTQPNRVIPVNQVNNATTSPSDQGIV